MPLQEDFSVVLPADPSNHVDERRAAAIAELDTLTSTSSLTTTASTKEPTAVASTDLKVLSNVELSDRLKILQQSRSLIDKIKAMKDFARKGNFVPGGLEEYQREVRTAKL